jgi:RHS repeat-associated protein
MATTAQLSENLHQGFDGLKAALCLESMEVKSNTASGIRARLRQNGIGSRSTGKERDAETGLDYFGARYYSGAQGRFTSADAPFADQHIENPQSWNLYIYTLNNPVRYVDPNGRGVIEGLKRAVDDIGIAALTMMLQPDRVVAGVWNAATHPTETVRQISANIQEFAHASLDDQITTITRVGVPILLGSAIGKATATAESLDTLGKASVSVTHFTDDLGMQGITNSNGVLRSGTYVTSPNAISTNASNGAVEKLLEIEPGRGTNSVTFNTPISNLEIPANGRTTSGNTIQYQLKGPAKVNPANFKSTNPTTLPRGISCGYCGPSC